MKPELVRRNEALVKTQARFMGKEFRLGSNDCVKLARFHLRALGRRDLPSTGHYKTVNEAAAQLKKQGARNLEQLLDKFLEPIPPAMMLPGDIALLKSDPDASGHELGTIAISLGRKLLGYHGDSHMLVVMEPLQIEKAWRALR